MRREGRVSVVVWHKELKDIQECKHPITQSLLKHCNHNAPTNKTIGIPLECPSRRGKCFMCAHPEKSGKVRRREMKKQLRFDMRYMSYDTYEY